MEDILRQAENRTSEAKELVKVLRASYDPDEPPKPSENLNATVWENTLGSSSAAVFVVLLAYVFLCLWPHITDKITSATKESKKMMEEIIKYEALIVTHASSIR